MPYPPAIPEGHTWAAHAIQNGTNDRMHATGTSREDVERKLRSQAYGPQFGTMRVYRIGGAA